MFTKDLLSHSSVIFILVANWVQKNVFINILEQKAAVATLPMWVRLYTYIVRIHFNLGIPTYITKTKLLLDE